MGTHLFESPCMSQITKHSHGAFLDFQFKKSMKCQFTMHLMFTKFDKT